LISGWLIIFPKQKKMMSSFDSLEVHVMSPLTDKEIRELRWDDLHYERNRYPKDDRLLVAEAWICFDDKRWNEALQKCYHAYGYNDKNIDIFVIQSKIYTKRRQFYPALYCCERAYALSNQDPKFALAFAIALERIYSHGNTMPSVYKQKDEDAMQKNAMEKLISQSSKFVLEAKINDSTLLEYAVQMIDKALPQVAMYAQIRHFLLASKARACLFLNRYYDAMDNFDRAFLIQNTKSSSPGIVYYYAKTLETLTLTDKVILHPQSSHISPPTKCLTFLICVCVVACDACGCVRVFVRLRRLRVCVL
jgi:tetratricopeptide (TPR) repeat protein